MTTGLSVNGTDLDSLLEPYHAGSKTGNTGIQVNGTDIANRYQAVAAGNGTAYGTTGMRTNGTDIGSLFVKLGTYTTASPLSVDIAGQTTIAYANGRTSQTTDLTASGAGGKSPYTYAWTFTRDLGLGTITPTTASTYQVTLGISNQSTNSETDIKATCVVTDAAGTQASTFVTVAFLKGTQA